MKRTTFKSLRRVRNVLLAAALPCAAFGEIVHVADSVRDASIDFWAAADVRLCRDVMDEVFALAGLEPQRATYGADGRIASTNVEVICSAFRTPTLLEDYDFARQPLGRMHYALYATPDRAELMTSMKITDWPHMKVAYSPVSQGRDNDREKYFQHAGLEPEYVEYHTSLEAVDALKTGQVDLLFLYTPYGKRPEGLTEIVPIGMRNIYFAVRRDRPDLMKRLEAAYREWYIDNIEKYDAWREEYLGIPRPVKRVRIAAYCRGDLFDVSPDGVRSGQIEDWMRSLCATTHWTPDYVYGDYDQCLDDVKRGRLDLVGGLGFTAARSKVLSYPHTPIGMLRVYLWTRPDSPYQPGHPETWRGMRIGVLAGTISGERVRKRLEERSYDISLHEYESDAKLKEAYFAGEIDACVDVEMPELANERALRIYASHPMYLVATPAKPWLFLELEHALDEVCDDFSKYMRLIAERHYGAHTEMSELTIKETEWLTKRLEDPTPIVIDFSPWPYPIMDEEGHATGFPKALLDEMHRRTGLDFKLSPQTGIQTAEAKFMRKDTQFWIPYPTKDEAVAYSSVSVFAMTVPQSFASMYGSEDFRETLEMLTHHSTPNELTSILRKCVMSIDPAQMQEMFMAAAAGRKAARDFFGLSDAELREVLFIGGAVIAVLLAAYAAIMVVLLKRQAHRAEASAERAHDLAQAKTRFLAMMSHELRTPLNAVIGFAEFLSREGTTEDRRKEYVDGILKSATALLELINDILDFSKLEAGAMDMRVDKCRIDKLVGELPAIFGYRVRQHGVTLEVRQTGIATPPPVKLSRQGLRQILLNIVGNAAKFTDHGKIVVEYCWRPETRTLRLDIYDTGRGISEEKMKQIFDPFTQDIASRMHAAAGDETKGTGLGLPIVKRLIDSARGTITVKSKLGAGTHFIIEFPDLEVVPESQPTVVLFADTKSQPKDLIPQRVLVVDDMAMNRKILGIHLANLGAKDVRFAENGAKALEVMASWRPDIVLTDMWMPEMDGYQLAEAIHLDARWENIPIVAVTADVDVESTYDVSLFTKVIAKPVTSAKLKALFEEIA